MPCQIVVRIHFVTVVISLADWAFLILRVIFQFPITDFTSYFFNDAILCLLHIYHETFLLLFIEKFTEFRLIKLGGRVLLSD